jgi:glutamate synthase (NADPH/NADH) small chain
MIGLLQRYSTDWLIQSGQSLFAAGAANGFRAAVVGGGPAGLSAARELARSGFAVTVFEAKPLAGGLNTHGIVSFRLPMPVSLWEVEQVKKLGVDIRTGVKIGVDITAEQIMNDYDAVVLAAGMGQVPSLGIEGESLAGVYDAIAFIENTKKDSPPIALSGAKVAVIGAGNTAIDAATCSVRLGAENVKIVYRRAKEQMTAYAFEYEFAKQDGVEFGWMTMPKRIIGDDAGKVTHLECVRMRFSNEVGKDGRPVPHPVEGSEFLMEVDAVVLAIGQSRHVGLIEAFGLEHDGGVVRIDPETRGTSHPKIYAAGDVAFGSGGGEAMVVSAVQQGKEAAAAITRRFDSRTHEAS